jgi:hypothetical protein
MLIIKFNSIIIKYIPRIANIIILVILIIQNALYFYLPLIIKYHYISCYEFDYFSFIKKKSFIHFHIEEYFTI